MAVNERPMSPWVVPGALIGLAVAFAAMAWFLVNVANPEPQWDLAVYRGAISTWIDGGSLYDFRLEHEAREGGFPFTYPPFAALVLLPTAWVPTVVADNAWTALSMLLVAAMSVFLVWRAPRTTGTWLGPEPSRPRLAGWAAMTSLALLLTFPGVHNIVLGQVSFLIIALVLFDVGGLVPARYRGVLVGLAAAIKLTPLIVVPYFLVTRQWRAAALSTGTFAAATLLAFAANPSDSVAYWTRQLLETSNVGEPATVQNKSLLGLLARWEVAGSAQNVLWVALVAGVVIMALIRARQQYLDGQPVAAALIVGCASVAASPISWPHHQGWIILVAVWLLLDRRWAAMAAGAVILLVFLVGSPLMGQEVVPQVDDAPLALRLGRELPTLAFLAVCLLGLPRQPGPRGRGSMTHATIAAPAASAPRAEGE